MAKPEAIEKKSVGKSKLDELGAAKESIDSLSGKEIAKLNSNDQSTLLKALALLLGVASKNGIIK